MKVVMQPIEILSRFNREGVPYPLKFKIEEPNSGPCMVKVDHILFRSEEKLAGNRMIVFRCQGVVNDTLKVFEIKYETATCRWFLYKI